MSQIQVPKLSSYTAIGPATDTLVVSKISTYILLVPGDDGGAGTTTRQGYAYAQKIRRG